MPLLLCALQSARGSEAPHVAGQLVVSSQQSSISHPNIVHDSSSAELQMGPSTWWIIVGPSI